jgi:ribosome-associated protein
MGQDETKTEKKKSSRTGRKPEADEAARADAQAAESAETAGQQEEGLDERMLEALRAASDKKAHDLVALDLRPVASFTDFFLIGSAANTRQVQAIADEVVDRLKRKGSRALRVEGYSSAEWVLIDYGDFIFHVFEEKARRFYDLERLWRDAPAVALPPELVGGAEGSLRSET